MKEVSYVGFWARAVAMLVDTFVLVFLLGLLGLILGIPTLSLDETGMPVFDHAYWAGHGSNALLGAVAIIGFWMWKMATPGKMLVSAVIVDSKTYQKPTIGQFIIRYLGYIVSSVCLLLGFIWVAFDARKQGWHDKMAGTVVIHRQR